MKAPCTIFGKTKMLEVVVYFNNRILSDATEWDHELIIDRAEDWYALMSPSFKNQKVRVISLDEWRKIP